MKWQSCTPVPAKWNGHQGTYISCGETEDVDFLRIIFLKYQSIYSLISYLWRLSKRKFSFILCRLIRIVIIISKSCWHAIAHLIQNMLLILETAKSTTATDLRHHLISSGRKETRRKGMQLLQNLICSQIVQRQLFLAGKGSGNLILHPSHSKLCIKINWRLITCSTPWFRLEF